MLLKRKGVAKNMPSPSVILKYITDGECSKLYRWEVMRIFFAFMIISNRKNLLSFGFTLHNFPPIPAIYLCCEYIASIRANTSPSCVCRTMPQLDPIFFQASSYRVGTNSYRPANLCRLIPFGVEL